jgi:hypothetical protein
MNLGESPIGFRGTTGDFGVTIEVTSLRGRNGSETELSSVVLTIRGSGNSKHQQESALPSLEGGRTEKLENW